MQNWSQNPSPTRAQKVRDAHVPELACCPAVPLPLACEHKPSKWGTGEYSGMRKCVFFLLYTFTRRTGFFVYRCPAAGQVLYLNYSYSQYHNLLRFNKIKGCVREKSTKISFKTFHYADISQRTTSIFAKELYFCRLLYFSFLFTKR